MIAKIYLTRYTASWI